MKQTETYELNLIETSDPFSPEALNDNARKLAAELARVDESLARVDAELERLDAALLKFACGTYTGNDAATRFIELPFTPKMVYVGNQYSSTFYYDGPYHYDGGIAMEGNPATVSSFTLVEIVEGGFRVFHNSGFMTSNYKNLTYRYFAIG